MTLLYFILVLCVTICIHEFGHFIFAKKAGIYVYEFSIGMGPRLFKFKRKNDETEYSIRLFPIGGYVSMAGEDALLDEKIPKEKQMCSKTWMERFLTISAGVLFNFALAIILLFIVGLNVGVTQSKPIIDSLEEGYTAIDSNMKKGDLITQVNGVNVKNIDQLYLEMEVAKGKKTNFTVKHQDGSKEVVSITPQKIESDGNTSYVYGFNLDQTKENGIVPSIKYAFRKTGSLLNQMCRVIFYLITGKISLNSLSGPIGIYTIVGDAASAGFINIIYLIAYLCINVGLINFIPLPAFDGGRALFLIIEKIKGSKINPKVENTIHSVGFVLLMLLMIVITFSDLTKIFK